MYIVQYIHLLKLSIYVCKWNWHICFRNNILFHQIFYVTAIFNKVLSSDGESPQLYSVLYSVYRIAQ